MVGSVFCDHGLRDYSRNVLNGSNAIYARPGFRVGSLRHCEPRVTRIKAAATTRVMQSIVPTR
jgi:hypothetical protein